jgi:hypothetical protein
MQIQLSRVWLPRVAHRDWIQWMPYGVRRAGRSARVERRVACPPLERVAM